MCYFAFCHAVDLDHTADIQLHAWGDSLRHAFENIVPCMFNYITDLSLVEIDENENVEFIVKGHDMKSLLFNMLDEFLYRFSTAGFVCKTAKVMNIDEVNFTMLIVG